MSQIFGDNLSQQPFISLTNDFYSRSYYKHVKRNRVPVFIIVYLIWPIYINPELLLRSLM